MKAEQLELTEDQISDVKIDNSKVKEALLALCNRASPGPDGIPTRCFKFGGEKITGFLLKHFRMSLDESDVPIQLKEAYITPVSKNGIWVFQQVTDPLL